MAKIHTNYEQLKKFTLNQPVNSKMWLITYAILTIFAAKVNGARILVVAPTPLLNHQPVFHSLIKELAEEGHEVTFITTIRAYPDENPTNNIKEIVLKDVSYIIRKEDFTVSDLSTDADGILKVFEEQLMSNEVQNLIKTKNSFDLLLLEAWSRPAMIWSHIYKVPVIKISTSGMALDNPKIFGVPTHPLLYPSTIQKRIYNLTFWETVKELYQRFCQERLYQNNVEEEDKTVRKIFGDEVPPLSDLQQNAHMIFLNVNSFWDRNRPLPRNVVYFGHVQQKPAEELPQDILRFLGSSQGIIYVSFGPSHLIPATIKIFHKVFAELPYKVLWQFDADQLEGVPDNVMIKEWFPDSDVLRHPNLKLIITQGDLQTTAEAIEVGVPLLGIPMLADQWLNVENYVQLGIGLQIDLENLNEKQFKSNIAKLVENPSYRKNILQLRHYIHDTQLTALNRAISWIEYVLKHSGVEHLKAPASNMSWWDYYEIELLFIVLNSLLIVAISIWCTVKLLLNKFDAIIAHQARINE